MFSVFCLFFVFICLLLSDNPPLSLNPAARQCLALGCLSQWQWRRIIVAVVMSWPYADTSWTGTSSRFTLSTLPAMMLWVIWQPANEQSEVFGFYFLNQTKDGCCGTVYEQHQDNVFICSSLCFDVFLKSAPLRWVRLCSFLAFPYIL